MFLLNKNWYIVGEGFTPPEENETGKNGYSQYIIYDNTVGE